MLKTFTGFKGLCAFAAIGNVQFVLLAKNKRDLEQLWNHIMTEAGPLDPEGCKKAILIEAPLLSASPISALKGQQGDSPGQRPGTTIPKTSSSPERAEHSASTTDPIDV